MLNAAQLEIAKTLWKQARVAASQSHEAWALVMKSQKTILDSMQGTGMPFTIAADHYQKLMDFHAEQYKAALEFIDYTEKEYKKALAHHKDGDTK